MGDFLTKILTPFRRGWQPLGRLVLVVTLLYTLALAFLSSRAIITLLDCATITFCFAIVRIYWREVWSILEKPKPQLYELLTVGVFLVSADTGIIRAWRLIWTALGNPAWFNNDQVWFGYVTLWQWVGFLLIMSAPRRTNGTLFYGARWTILTAALSAALLLIFVLIARAYINGH